MLNSSEKEKLFNQYKNLAKKIARKWRYMDKDVEQAAYVGLLIAIDKRRDDLEFNNFPKIARFYIGNEIRKELGNRHTVSMGSCLTQKAAFSSIKSKLKEIPNLNKLSSDEVIGIIKKQNSQYTKHSILFVLNHKNDLHYDNQEEGMRKFEVKDYNVYEKNYANKLILEQIFDILNKKDKEILNMKMDGFSNKEIEKKYKVSHTYIHYLYKKIRKNFTYMEDILC